MTQPLSKMEQHHRFMRRAIQRAREGLQSGQTPFGACIVRKGRIVSCEHNGVWKGTDITAHAEICAIRLACKNLRTIDLSECVIYSTCEPCPMCFSACHWARIPVIYFGARIRDAQKIGFNELTVSNRQMKKLGGSRIKIVPNVLRQENLRLFQEWHGLEKKRGY
ncbi:MAG TPA: nucleoside deaminase [Candidatus Omnitrophota bacterium]|nr:nucleoside deaminase [Candidatus Omnitrophota bacterium]HQO57705.1 nucleoside deaminase [Candidatus Omnitrophota bacterium]HQP12073.1 nucleoside deaminase [Candidatus Omnitrophota bacterium]